MKKKDLHNRLREKLEPKKSWNLYECTLHGHANTYEEALERLDKLTTQQWAFTNDTDHSSEKVSKILKKIEKAHKYPIYDSDVPSLNDSEDLSHSDADSNEDTRRKKKKVEKLHKKTKEFCQTLSDVEEENTPKKVKLGAKNSKMTCSTSQKEFSSQLPLKPSFAIRRYSPKKMPAAKELYSLPSNSEKLPSSSVRSSDISENQLTFDILLQISKDVAEIKSEQKFLREEVLQQGQILQEFIDTFSARNYISEAAASKEKPCNLHAYSAKYAIAFPMDSRELLQSLDTILKNDKTTTLDFTVALASVYSKKLTLSKNLTTIIRAIVYRKLILKYTAVKPMGTKLVFKQAHPTLFNILYKFLSTIQGSEILCKKRILEVLLGRSLAMPEQYEEQL